jgi:hypothetical protein
LIGWLPLLFWFSFSDGSGDEEEQSIKGFGWSVDWEEGRRIYMGWKRKGENMWGRVRRAGHAGGAARLSIFFYELIPLYNWSFTSKKDKI